MIFAKSLVNTSNKLTNENIRDGNNEENKKYKNKKIKVVS
jgi:hypothetical protein